MASPYPNTLTINHYLCEKLTGNTATYQIDGDAFMGMISTQGNNAGNSWRHTIYMAAGTYSLLFLTSNDETNGGICTVSVNNIVKGTVDSSSGDAHTTLTYINGVELNEGVNYITGTIDVGANNGFDWRCSGILIKPMTF